jgi:hypothetical protein
MAIETTNSPVSKPRRKPGERLDPSAPNNLAVRAAKRRPGGVRGDTPMAARPTMRLRRKPTRGLDENEQKRIVQFVEWLGAPVVTKRDRFAYYTGRLAADRQAGEPFAEAIAGIAWQASVEKRVMLVQQRHENGAGYRYIAMKNGG